MSMADLDGNKTFAPGGKHPRAATAALLLSAGACSKYRSTAGTQRPQIPCLCSAQVRTPLLVV